MPRPASRREPGPPLPGDLPHMHGPANGEGSAHPDAALPLSTSRVVQAICRATGRSMSVLVWVPCDSEVKFQPAQLEPPFTLYSA